MVEEGIVSDIKDGRLIVSIRRRPACGGCRLCSMGADREMVMEFENKIGARKGERVNIELDDSVILKGAFLFYIVPLLGLIFGIFIGRIFTKKVYFGIPDEAIWALSGIIIMLATFVVIRRYNLAKGDRHKPRISKA